MKIPRLVGSSFAVPWHLTICLFTGSSLIKLGRAHCKVATLQEGYALTFKDTFIASIEKFTNEIKEYDMQRKKLDSRRCVSLSLLHLVSCFYSVS